MEVSGASMVDTNTTQRLMLIASGSSASLANSAPMAHYHPGIYYSLPLTTLVGKVYQEVSP